jgi:putative Mn2+ efflux pump MntP
MNIIEVFLIAVSMGVDAFAVCISAGTMPQAEGPRPAFRLAFHFGLFQFLMPVSGWLVGVTIARAIASVDHWIAFGLLAFVGVRMIRSGMDPNHESSMNNPSRGWTLVLLSLAVSIDALAVGFSLGLIGVFVWYPAIAIGVITGLMSLLGLRLGIKLGRYFGKRMELIGGLVLLAIGIRIVMSHLLG